jgi:hypothetical protein
VTPPLADVLGVALATGDDCDLRSVLLAASRLPGPRMNLRLIDDFAAAVGDVVGQPAPPVAALEAILDAWAAMPVAAAPADQPSVILPCAAVAAYGEVAARRPDWWPDEIAKLRRAAADPRWRVRELVAQALQRMLEADWPRAVAELDAWTASDDPLVLRAVAAAVAEPRLLGVADRADMAAALQRRVVGRYRAIDVTGRRTEAGRALRQALGFTISVTAAATGDLGLLDELAASDDTDLRWIARQNLSKARLRGRRAIE